MKNSYKRQAWLLDDGLLLAGYVAKHKFIPDDKRCGFSSQIIRKKDVGRIIFYDESKVKQLKHNFQPIDGQGCPMKCMNCGRQISLVGNNQNDWDKGFIEVCQKK